MSPSFMEEGEFLRHLARPDWGIGQVTRRSDDLIDVQFMHARVLLKLSVASQFLQRISKAEATLAGVALPSNRDGAATKPKSKRTRRIAQ